MPVVRLGGSALDVQLVRELAGSVLVEESGEADVSVSSEVTLATATVNVDTYIRIKAVWGEGDGDGKWTLYRNGSLIYQARNSWSNKNILGLIEIQADAGDVVTLKVTNLHNTTNHYTGGFYAYELIAGA